jgi:uncharacterized protein YndB with AHSA1/START domain
MASDISPEPDSDFDPSRDLRVERLIRAPVALVWRCIVEADLLKRWWVPAPVVITDLVLDPVPGGRFFTNMLMPDGVQHGMDMAILQADAGRLVFTDMMSAGFRPVAEPMFGFVGILALTEVEGGTAYTATARHARAETARRHDEMGFRGGWGAVADQLAALAPTL